MLLVLFSLLMLAVAADDRQPKSAATRPLAEGRHRARGGRRQAHRLAWARLHHAGAGHVGGLPIQRVGTSSSSREQLGGLLGHPSLAALDYGVIALLRGERFRRRIRGARLACYIRPAQLRTGFAVFVVALGLFLFIDNVGNLL